MHTIPHTHYGTVTLENKVRTNERGERAQDAAAHLFCNVDGRAAHVGATVAAVAGDADGQLRMRPGQAVRMR